MGLAFFIAAAVAAVSTVLVIFSAHVVHALLYLVLSLLSVAIIFFLLGAPFAAALEVIIYAGAIMVTFVFVMMMLNLGRRGEEIERRNIRPALWAGPFILGLVLLAELLYVLAGSPPAAVAAGTGPTEVGIALFGPYLLAVELAAFLMMVGLVGAYHLGKED